MNSRQARSLKVGDVVYNGSLLKGAVYTASKDFVVIVWQHTDQHDVLSRSSQMWLFLEKQ